MKQHYGDISRIVKKHTTIVLEEVAGLSGMLAIDHPGFVEELAEYFAKNDPGFDRDKFIEACV